MGADTAMGKPGEYQAWLHVSGGESEGHRDPDGFLLDPADEGKRLEVWLDPAGQYLFAQLVLTKGCKDTRNVRASGSLSYLVDDYLVQKKTQNKTIRRKLIN